MSNINVLAHQLFKKTVITTTICFSLLACTQVIPAPIQDGDSVQRDGRRLNNDVDVSGSDYTPPPSSIANKRTSSAPVAPKTVATNLSQSEIVYQRDYTEIPKGGYKGNKYKVNRGDTLFYIAWITGNDYRELARRNNLSEPYSLSVGQSLDVSGGVSTGTESVAIAKNQPKPQYNPPVKLTTEKIVKAPKQPPITQPPKKVEVAEVIDSTEMIPTKPRLTTETITTTNQPNISPRPVNTPPPAASSATSTVANIKWQWPVRGSIIAPFSSSANGNKGIDIAGSQGQDIAAAADGRVVYAGNALPGYGNLIIIKHNEDYLTAYAHNDKIYIQEQQSVKAGQRIAAMGKTGTSSTRLHFEIRYKAKSLDPMKFLPK